VNLTRADGTAVLERGDTVILDNCGFHHGHFVEPILREMLGECCVKSNLLFQPPYSPEFNSCELCFHDIKEFLRRNQRLAEEHTEYAIYEAGANITQAKSVAYFLHLTVDTCCRSRTMNFSVNCPAHLYRKQLLPQCCWSNKQYYAALYSLSHVCLLWEVVYKYTPAIQSAEWVVYESVNNFRENGVSPHVINKGACDPAVTSLRRKV